MTGQRLRSPWRKNLFHAISRLDFGFMKKYGLPTLVCGIIPDCIRPRRHGGGDGCGCGQSARRHPGGCEQRQDRE